MKTLILALLLCCSIVTAQELGIYESPEFQQLVLSENTTYTEIKNSFSEEYLKEYDVKFKQREIQVTSESIGFSIYYTFNEKDKLVKTSAFFSGEIWYPGIFSETYKGWVEVLGQPEGMVNRNKEEESICVYWKDRELTLMIEPYQWVMVKRYYGEGAE